MRWVNCSERLPTEQDGDNVGIVVVLDKGLLWKLRWDEIRRDDGQWLENNPPVELKLSNPDPAFLLEVINPITIATISRDGIMRFNVEANDQHAKAFLDCIEKSTGVKIEKIGVVEK